MRQDGAGGHLSACHFAEPRLVVETVDVSDLEPDERFVSSSTDDLDDVGSGLGQDDSLAPDDRSTVERSSVSDPQAPADTSRVVQDTDDQQR